MRTVFELSWPQDYAGRERAGEPEYPHLWPAGYLPSLPGSSVHICDELVWEPVDRERLRVQASALLNAVRENQPRQL
ncbi:hypothetical protein JIG36_23445 [Actinoplanes sp. LDG1-06]|uniref:Uncharacterized protein n=1 Tax=Paractinoplanes ovalisporus TaxID=2810368 RepID=A0ABS2AH16_9ACTN|nr:hypothetical protein [Actinoplanes ovalisporus]MBM2618516.1 hypothetical protein [Actinoplanes ovalisporus]